MPITQQDAAGVEDQRTSLDGAPARARDRGLRSLAATVVKRAGGRRRATVIALLGAVLGLQTADTSTVGAVAPQLQSALHIDFTRIGLLISLALIVAGLATVPIGRLVDRVNRVRLLTLAIVLWSLAMVAAGASRSYAMLLASRVVLGGLAATALPVAASLIGDFFYPDERGAVWGWVLSGELIGAGFGLLIGGTVAGALSWRFSFWLLALISLALAALVWRLLREPARGGRGRLPRRGVPADENEPLAQEVVEDRGVEPLRSRILDRDPQTMSLWAAVRYILRVRTNVIIIVCTAFAYAFQSAEQAFAVEFFRVHYRLGQSAATLALVGLGSGAVVGVLVAGRIADRALRGGRVNARIVVGGLSYVIAAILFVPCVTIRFLPAVAIFLFAGAAALSGGEPALDAARLDIMHSRLWGRAEGVRTALRTIAQAAAPLIVGAIADEVGGAGVSSRFGHTARAGANLGLEVAFLVMLVPLLVGGVVALVGRRSYARDVATAAASDEAFAGS